jgi:hypothetical protein
LRGFGGLADGFGFRAGRAPPGLALRAFAGLTLAGLAFLARAGGTTLTTGEGLSALVAVSLTGSCFTSLVFSCSCVVCAKTRPPANRRKMGSAKAEYLIIEKVQSLIPDREIW